MIYTTEQNRLIGALIGLCRTCDSTGLEIKDTTYEILIRGMYSLSDKAKSDNIEYSDIANKAAGEKFRLSPGCASCASPCGRTLDYNMDNINADTGEIRAAKLEILSLLTEMSEHIYLDMKIAEIPEEVKYIYVKSLFAVGEFFTLSELQALDDEINIYLAQY